MPKKLVLNPEFEKAPYEYAFCDCKGENIQRLPEGFILYRFDKDFKRVFKYIEVCQ